MSSDVTKAQLIIWWVHELMGWICDPQCPASVTSSSRDAFKLITNTSSIFKHRVVFEFSHTLSLFLPHGW
jgi:hypothetical protein